MSGDAVSETTVFDPAVHFGFADNPMKIALMDASFPDHPQPVTLLQVLEVQSKAIIVGVNEPEDICRTTFDRQTGKAIDRGRMLRFVIPKTELDRLEEFALQGAYEGMVAQPVRPPTIPLTAPPPGDAPDEPFDLDAMMG